MVKVKRIIVVGSDIDAWLTAMSLQLFLAGGETDISIEIVELPTRLHAMDFYSSQPSLRSFHRTMAIPEPKVLRSAAGKFTSGQRLCQWVHRERDFLLAYQTIENTGSANDTNNSTIPLIGESNRSKKDRMPIDIYTHLNNVKLGLNLDAMGYTNLVMRDALSLNIKHKKTTRIKVNSTGARIDGLQLDNGTMLTADLYVDATGPKAKILSTLPDYRYNSWREWLPANIKFNARIPAPKTPSNYTVIRGEQYGWTGTYNLTGEVGIRCVYENTESTLAIENHLQSSLESKLIHSREIPLKQGAVNTPWIQNCIAIGDASSTQEPLVASDLTLLTQGISHLILALTQSRSLEQAQTTFNQNLTRVSEELRDMLITTRILIRHTEHEPGASSNCITLPDSLLTRLENYRANTLPESTQNPIYGEKHWASVFNQMKAINIAT